MDDFGDPNDLERWRCSCGRPNPGVVNRCEECGRGQYADELLGIDPDNPLDRRAGQAVGAIFMLIQSLVAVRRRRGLSVAEVAAAIGKTPMAVIDFESMNSDPHLSMIRRYAVAVGATVSYEVK